MTGVPEEFEERLARVRNYAVVESKILSASLFDDSVKKWRQFFELRETHPILEDLKLPVMYWLDNTVSGLLVSDLLRMREAWYGREVQDAAEILKVDPLLRELSIDPLPPNLDRSKPTGELLVDLGWLEADSVNRAIEVRELLRNELGVRFKVASLLMALQELDILRYHQIMAFKLRVPFRSLTIEALDAIKLRMSQLDVSEYDPSEVMLKPSND